MNNEDIDINSLKNKNDKSISDIVNGIKESDLKKFLTQLLQENEKIYDRFRIHFISEFPILSLSNYKNKIRKAISDVAGRDGFIDYSEGWNYVHAMYNFTKEAHTLIDNGDFELAFDITTLILDEIPGLAIDGSNGETGDVASECIEIIEKILEFCNNKEVIKKILKYVSDEILTETLSNYGIELYELIDWFIQK